MSYLVELAFDGPALLTSVNPRSERHGDDLELAIDLNFEAVTTFEYAAKLFRIHEKELTKALATICHDKGVWRSELGEIRLARNNKFSSHKVTIITRNRTIEIPDADICKFALTKVKDGHDPKLKFQVQAEVGADQAGALSEALVDPEVNLRVEAGGQPDML